MLRRVKRSRAGPLVWALYGRLAGSVCAAWPSGEGTARRQQAVEAVQCDAWTPARAGGGVGAALHGGRRTAPAVREQRGRQGKEKRDLFAISKISWDLNVKQ